MRAPDAHDTSGIVPAGGCGPYSLGELTDTLATMTRSDRERAVCVSTTRAYLWLKGVMDRYLALVLLVALAPVLLILAFRIRRDSPGPALFAQRRAGLRGKPFTFYKFRTMRSDADPFGDSPESGQDPRLTPIGRRLRESSLDELPQLINVVRGQMSLVGPRPLFVQQIPEWSARHRARLLVKPGITGYAQIRGRASIPIEQKLELDVEYVQNLSLSADLCVLWQTLRSVARRDDLYQVEYSRTRRRFTDQRTSHEA